MQHDVFLSYSREDVAIMQKIRDELRADGFAVWTDEGIEPGTPSWKIAIEEALLNTTSVVVLLSPSASQSKWVRNELDFAETHRKRIFPMMVRGDAEQSVPFGFTTYQWIDIRDKKQFETGLASLKTTLHKAKGEPVPEAPTTHQLAESNTTSKFLPLMIAVGLIALIAISALLYFMFFTPENPDNLAAEVTDEPLITVTNTALPTEAPSEEVTDEASIEATEAVDVPAGWQWVENDSARFIVPADSIPMTQEQFASVGSQIPEFGNVNMDEILSVFPENEYLSYANWLTFTGITFAVDDVGIALPMDALQNRYQLMFEQMTAFQSTFEQVELSQGEALKIQAEIAFVNDSMFRYTLYAIPLNDKIYVIGIGGIIPYEEMQSLLDTILGTLQIKDAEPVDIVLPPEEIESTDDIPDGWRVVDLQSGSLLVPNGWLSGDMDNPTITEIFPLIFGDHSLESILAPSITLDVGVATVLGGFTGVTTGFEEHTDNFVPTRVLLQSILENYLNEFGEIISNETVTIPMGDVSRVFVNIDSATGSVGDWQMLAYMAHQDTRTGYIFVVVLADNYDTMLPTIEQIVDSWQLDN